MLLARVSPVLNAPKWDEFIYVYDSQRILSGQVPYRDFFQFTPPADLLALAAWFKLFGGTASLTLGRYLALLLALLGWAWMARALRRAGWGSFWALALASLYPLAFYPFWAIPSHHWMAALLLPAALEAWDFQRQAVRGTGGWLWAGACLGAALLTLQTAVALLAVFFGVAWLRQAEGKARSALGAATGALATLAPLLLWLGAHGALWAFVGDVFLWPGRHYAAPGGINDVRFLQDLPSRLAALWQSPQTGGGSGWELLAGAATAVFVGLLMLAGWLVLSLGWWIIKVVRARRLPPGIQPAAAAGATVALTLYLLGKTDWLHLLYVLVPAGLIWLCASAPEAGVPAGRWKGALLVALLACSLSYQAGRLVYHVPAGWELTDVDRPVREAPVNVFLRAQEWLAPGDRIAAFPEGGEVYLYTRPAAVSYTLLYPPGDRYHGEGDYRQVAREILEHRPKCVVVTQEAASQFLERDCPLAKPLTENYTKFAAVDGVEILRLREEP